MIPSMILFAVGDELRLLGKHGVMGSVTESPTSDVPAQDDSISTGLWQGGV
jgi:hypothetical protein